MFFVELFYTMNKIILRLLLVFISVFFVHLVFACNSPSSPYTTPFPQRQNLSESNKKYENIALNWIDIPQIILLGFGLLFLFWITLLYLCNQVNYVTFNTNLDSFKKNSNPNVPQLWFYLLIALLGLLLTEYPEDFSVQLFTHYLPNLAFLTAINPKVYKRLARVCFHTSCVLIFTDSISPATCILSIFVFQIWCHVQSRKIPWLPLILILLANDIELNPGPPLQNQFLSFMNWNLNSLVKQGVGYQVPEHMPT